MWMPTLPACICWAIRDRWPSLAYKGYKERRKFATENRRALEEGLRKNDLTPKQVDVLMEESFRTEIEDATPLPAPKTHNGWIYLHFGDRCRDCTTSMNRVIRGRIANGRWTDEETIWRAAPETYTEAPDIGAGGRPPTGSLTTE